MFHTIQPLCLLAPPGGAPAGRTTSSVTLRRTRFLAAILNNLDYTQVYTRNLGVGEKFSRILSRFRDPPHLTGFQHAPLLFHSCFKPASLFPSSSAAGPGGGRASPGRALPPGPGRPAGRGDPRPGGGRCRSAAASTTR